MLEVAAEWWTSRENVSNHKNNMKYIICYVLIMMENSSEQYAYIVNKSKLGMFQKNVLMVERKSKRFGGGKTLQVT